MTPERYARVKNLFLQACELDESDRRAFLTEQCSDDIELRKEVESLLANDNSQTLIRSYDTLPNVDEGTVVQLVKRSVSQRLLTLGLLTQRLGPRGHLALGGFVACAILMLAAILASHSIRAFQEELRAEALQELVDAKCAGLEMWFEHEEEKVESWVRSEGLRRHANELIQLAADTNDDWDAVRDSPLQKLIQNEIHQLAGKEVSYAIWDSRNITVAESTAPQQLVGQTVTPFGASALAFINEGRSKIFSYDKEQTITKMDPSIVIEPHVGVLTPIRDQEGRISGAFLVHDHDAREKANRILRVVQLGSSGESYAFNERGVMLSESRFADQLREIGLLPSDAHGNTSRIIQLRDPGGDMTQGYRPTESLSAQPLTKMARHATAGEDGFDVKGYRDYRGVQVAGAWRWLDEHHIGVATELDMSESDPGHRITVFVTWGFLGLLATCLGIIVYSYYSILKLRGEVGEHRRLGRYVLEQQIGEGGMGKVFKARHEFLKRPTAIKLLKPELVDKKSIARFEREASLASQLTHPNTIDVYDYGVTPEGIFFFVMEHIEGLSLAELVREFGPVPPARVVCFLTQISESLAEAHAAGMIHRDLKPQNIMICQRGGKADVIKVLDFGLVKQTTSVESQQFTASTMLAGTPLYIAPERVRDPGSANPQTDIYSLGAVAYFLLTGQDVFGGKSIADVLYQAMDSPPPRPADLQPEIPRELDQLVVDCLAKQPDHRPASVSDIIKLLERLETLSPWSQATAQLWWSEHFRRKSH